jgi:hypothetical protein
MKDDHNFQIGDIIQVNGPTVPVDLRDKYFRVEGIDEQGSVRLSLPYLDRKLTRRYHPPDPRRPRH